VADNYGEIQAVNWSSLKLLEPSAGGSPLFYRWHRDHPRPDTAAMKAGRAFHCATLEPDKFDERYAVLQGSVPDNWSAIWSANKDGSFSDKFVIFDELTKKGEPYKKRTGPQWEAFAQRHGDDPRPILLEHELDRAIQLGNLVGEKEILTPDGRETALAMAEAVRSHRKAGPLLKGIRCEETVTWTDPITGMVCKGRLDGIGPIYLLDLKATSKPIGREVKFGFGRQASDLLYHGQFAWYHDGALLAKVLPTDAVRPWVIVCTADPPHDVRVDRVKAAALESGRRLYRRLLDTLHACTVADYWPGACPDEGEWEPEFWAAGNDSEGPAEAGEEPF